MVRSEGLEPPAKKLWVSCSNQLSYKRVIPNIKMVLRAGIEPAHPKIMDFKSIAATYYAIGAFVYPL